MQAPPAEPAALSRARTRAGLFYGLAAYGLWGVLPLYFKALGGVGAIDIVAHRVLWSLFVLGGLLALTGGFGDVGRALADARTRLLLLASALLIAVNWLLYVYAIHSGHILAGSLGYYLNPLANIVMGRFLLGERLGRLQWAAVALAASGVAVLAAGALDTLWISLALCFSFASYGFLRKIAPVESLAGLTVETLYLVPLALGWLAWAALATTRPWFGSDGGEAALLVAAGVVSTVPLLCFTAAARRLPYSTVGMLQFLAPSIQFALAVGVYREEFTRAHGVAFGAIWAALALYVAGMMRARAPLAGAR